ncbi:GNAT family N-acetyltransferase [Nocardia spumae]|uniref:GNAT family N-acetyltransferase n=1 Tax=Nocardia spumae TaxID=2887190 RepID=UPI001D156A6C|nr:GNAT family N-acetyltransferase [Nocardia spumae]
MSTTTIRPAEDDELAAVAQLRWRWFLENQGTPPGPQEEFIESFASWARDHRASHHCLVLIEDEAFIGMAWLAITPRVPGVLSRDRAMGDLQSMYVIPERRNDGLGGRLIDAVVDLAGRLGLERVTVQSTKNAVNAYTRHGFATSPGLLHTEPRVDTSADTV